MITAFGESSNNYDVTNFMFFRTVRCNIFVQYKPTKCKFPELIYEFMISSTCFETEGSST